MKRVLFLLTVVVFCSCSKEDTVTVKYSIPDVAGDYFLTVKFLSSGGVRKTEKTGDGWEFEFEAPKGNHYQMEVRGTGSTRLGCELYIDGILIDSDRFGIDSKRDFIFVSS